MICKWCNREIQENSQFCPHCGRELNGVSNNIEQNTTIKNEDPNNLTEKKETKEPKKFKKSIICTLVILGVIVLIIYKIGLTTTDKEIDNDSSKNEQQETIEENNENDTEESTTENNKSNEITETNLTNDWKKYEVSINNKTISLPTTYNDLSSVTGFSFKSSDLKSYAQGGYYVVLNMYKNDKLALYVESLNDTDKDLLYTDCKITRISQTKYQVSQGADIVVFPGNLKAGDSITESKIIELFGTPNDIDEYSSDGYESKTYKYTEDSTYTTTNKYHIKVVNGIIDELQLDNRN